MLDRDFSPKPTVLRQLEDGIEDALICACLGRPLPQVVCTIDANNGQSIPRFMVTIDDEGQGVLMPVPDSQGKIEMSILDLLVASGVREDGFPGYFLTGNARMIGSVANG